MLFSGITALIKFNIVNRKLREVNTCLESCQKLIDIKENCDINHHLLPPDIQEG